MNILLVGEFSRLHNSLKEGLLALGHQVTICGLADGFKDFPIDWPVHKRWDSGWQGKLRSGLFRLTGFDLSSWLTYRQFLKYVPQLASFDCIQLINENSFLCHPAYEQKILRKIFAAQKPVFLLSCGNDYLNVAYNFAHPEEKSILQPYLNGKIAAEDFQSALKFTQPAFERLHHYLFERIAGVIATDLDYVKPLNGHPKFRGLIPNPINISQITAVHNPVIDGKVVIFHGINTQNYYKKGNDLFEQALAEIGKRYGDRVEIISVRSLPYAQYIQQYDRAHILLDQCYAKDQGYNALEAMAKGKVVFTGAEQEFIDRYKIGMPVNCNATANVQDLIAQLAYLIENPEALEAIGHRARTFIEKEHDYKRVAASYLEVWKQT